jgi:hypothetical protein
VGGAYRSLVRSVRTYVCFDVPYIAMVGLDAVDHGSVGQLVVGDLAARLRVHCFLEPPGRGLPLARGWGGGLVAPSRGALPAVELGLQLIDLCVDCCLVVFATRANQLFTRLPLGFALR